VNGLRMSTACEGGLRKSYTSYMRQRTKTSAKEIIREHMRRLGRKGGAKDGKARAAKLSPEQRRESARKAARARWRKS
jgi:hypothetical protein